MSIRKKDLWGYSEYERSIKSGVSSRYQNNENMKKNYGINSVYTWKNDSLESGLRNTQQLNVDWSDFSQHVFFSSAEAKVNVAFDKIINGFPFDGAQEEIQEYLASLSGYETYILEEFPKNIGYITLMSASNNYIKFTDKKGYIFPALSKVSDMNSSVFDYMGGDNSLSIEFHYAHPTGSIGTTQDMVIFQALNNSGTSGISIFIGQTAETSPTFTMTSVMTDKNNTQILSRVSGIKKGKFNHFVINYENSKSNRLKTYVNYILKNSSSEQSELLSLFDDKYEFYIGYGNSHTYYDGGTVTSNADTSYLTGSIKDFRIWNKTFATTSDMKYIAENGVFSQDSLRFQVKFNEPSGSHANSSVVIDSSGNGIHGLFYTNGSQAIVDLNREKETYTNPTIYSNPLLNPILFPAHSDVVSFNQRLLEEAFQYDINNPNLITKLVPAHYFREAEFFEGFTEEDIGNDFQTINNFPRGGKIPQSQLITLFLFIWANFFDEIKLYVDSFRSLRVANYESKDSIPLQFMPFLARYYGFELPNPFSNANLNQYLDASDITAQRGRTTTSLQKSLEQMWNRMLVEMPYVIRSKGTKNAIKALMNSAGINMETTFRMKEYGGSTKKKILKSRKKKESQYNFIDFVTASYMQSKTLKAYRHEPGAPDPASGPSIDTVLIEAGDIRIVKPGNPPTLTQITSGSWTWEGHYQFNPETIDYKQSLFRIECEPSSGSDKNLLVNLVASRSADFSLNSNNLTLYVDAANSGSTTISFDNTRMWDGSRWYISVSHEFGFVSSSYYLHVYRPGQDNIITEYTGSFTYVNTTNNLLSTFDTTENPSSFGPKIVIGQKSGGTTYTSNYLGNAGDYARTQVFDGKLGQFRIWSKFLSGSERIEHAINPFSVAVENPIVNYNFITDINLDIANTSTQIESAIPEGAWERIRGQYELYQSVTSSNSSGLLNIEDISRNDITFFLTGSADSRLIKSSPITYTIINPYFADYTEQNKVRIHSYLTQSNAEKYSGFHGSIYDINEIETFDDNRFSIDMSSVQSIDEDIMNLMPTTEILNQYLGSPELQYSVNYPQMDKLSDIYFNRLSGKMNYTQLFEFFKWFRVNFAPIIEKLLPSNVNFLGVNFVIESHFLERNKYEYKQGDVHVDLNSRVAAELTPLPYEGTFKKEI
ncbi:hypothetical protein [Limnobacter sp.]|uniref:hypothetical protein n=1 Tax=Limnobacter sp. TaxID=2003368 RepID=UPI00311E5870